MLVKEFLYSIENKSSLSVGIFTRLLKYYQKSRAILVKKLGERKKIVKIRFRLFYEKKLLPLSTSGGNYGPAIKKVTFLCFCSFPLCLVASP